MSKYANYHRQSTSSGKVMHQRLRVTVVGFGWYCNIIYKWIIMGLAPASDVVMLSLERS